MLIDSDSQSIHIDIPEVSQKLRVWVNVCCIEILDVHISIHTLEIRVLVSLSCLYRDSRCTHLNIDVGIQYTLTLQYTLIVSRFSMYTSQYTLDILSTYTRHTLDIHSRYTRDIRIPVRVNIYCIKILNIYRLRFSIHID